MSTHAAVRSRLAPALAAGWFLVALVVGALGLLAALPFPGPQVLILALVAASPVIGFGVAPVRASIEAIPLRTLVGVHIIRFIGIAFLILAARGELSPMFAERAGWGDIVTALGALALVASGPPRGQTHRALYLVWNTVGLLDLVIVVATAAYVGARGLTPGLTPLLHLPLSLLPTFFVPLLIASHIFLFRRLAAEGGLASEGRASHAA